MRDARLQIPGAALRILDDLCSERGAQEHTTSRLADAVGTRLPSPIMACVLTTTPRINESRGLSNKDRITFLADLLETYGKTVLSLCICHDLITRQRADSPQALSAGISATKTPIIQAAAERIKLEGYIALGVGQRSEPAQRSVRKALA